MKIFPSTHKIKSITESHVDLDLNVPLAYIELDYSKYKKIYNVAKANYASVAIPDSNVKAYVKEADGPEKTYKNSDLAFNENNGFNTSVKTYMTKIMKTYKDAIAKWN